MPSSTCPHQCGHRIWGNLFPCFFYSQYSLLQFFLSEPPEVRKFCPFQRLFRLVRASELTRNQNGMLHYVKTVCLVCLLRNNQEKLYVKRHRCSLLRNRFILLKYMKKSSWNLEQYVFCISTYLIDSIYTSSQNISLLWKMPKLIYLAYIIIYITILYVICSTRQQMFIMLMLTLSPACFFENILKFYILLFIVT